jgi:hypothetical protein
VAIDDDGLVRTEPVVVAVALAACGRIDFGASTTIDARELGDARTADASTPGDADQVVVIVSDDFGRSIASDWGSADVGGAWSVFNPDGSTVSVDAGHGEIAMTSATGYADCHVASAIALDTETRVVAAFDRLPTTGSYTATVSARWSANGTDYRLHLDVLAGGSAATYIDEAAGGTYVDIQDGTVPFTVTASSGVAMSLVATGASPTVLCGKVWPANAAEPSACTVSVQDSTPALQVPGISYLDTYDTDDTPPTFSFSTFRFLRVGAE